MQEYITKLHEELSFYSGIVHFLVGWFLLSPYPNPLIKLAFLEALLHAIIAQER